VCAAWLLLPVTLPAQRSAALEVSLGGVAALAREAFVGGSVGVAARGRARERLALSVAGGSVDGTRAARVEPSLQFLLNPGARAAPTLYGGLGIAYTVRQTARAAGYLLLLAGVERGAATSPGWYVELGLGGGVRLAAGLRIRAFRGR
jgi:hypothetical protein